MCCVHHVIVKHITYGRGGEVNRENNLRGEAEELTDDKLLIREYKLYSTMLIVTWGHFSEHRKYNKC